LTRKNVGIDNPMYGKHHSEESRKKMSLSHKGFKASEETKRKMSLAQKGKHLSEEIKIRLREKRKLNRNPRKRWTNHYGYVLIYKPDHPFANKRGYIQESRFIMEGILKRYLDKKELVHHINGIRYDNRPENLCVVNNHNHEHRTFVKILQKRILELEKGK